MVVKISIYVEMEQYDITKDERAAFIDIDAYLQGQLYNKYVSPL